MRFPKTRLLFLIGLLSLPLFSQTYFVTAPGSKLWLEGSSNVNTFSCVTFSVDGNGILVNRDSLRVSISVFVRSMDCGNKMMNSDMMDAMKADSFPFIRYELISTKILSSDVSALQIEANGSMRIKETTKRFDMPVSVQIAGSDTMHVRGKKLLAMSDFEISPPSALFGLIKANDELTVHFDLIVRKRNEKEEALLMK